jgi:hypothetical protein
VTQVQGVLIQAAHAPRMPSETRHNQYRSWAELAEAAKSDYRAWLFLLNAAPWAAKLLEERKPTKH